MKNVLIKFSNGEEFLIPASIVAENKSEYYASKEGEIGSESYKSTYDEEYENIIEDDSEIMDWLCNNMDWVDVKDHATLVDNELEFNYDGEFTNAEKDIIDS